VNFVTFNGVRCRN